MKNRFAILILLAVTGCTGADAVYYSDAPISKKTITVPPGNRGVIGLVKNMFRQHGWQQAVYRGPTVTRGTLVPETNIKTSDTFLTRYALLIDQTQWDICFDGGGAYRYELSVIDNETGEEIFASHGNACESVIKSALEKKMVRFW